MTGARGTTERFRALVHRRLLPGLGRLGFTERLPGTLAATEAQGVAWLLDLDVAPWSTPHRVSFTVAWGVFVPGLDEAAGDPPPEVVRRDRCVVTGRAGERPGGLEAHWFELRSLPGPLAGIADGVLAGQVLAAVEREVLPALRALSTPVEVQHHLHRGLVTGRGVPGGDELRTIRRIAALSLLLGDRQNAARWLDHLERRSAVAMAPDLVVERLAPLRERLAS